MGKKHHARILEILSDGHERDALELAILLDVHEATARNDLLLLTLGGKVHRRRVERTFFYSRSSS